MTCHTLVVIGPIGQSRAYLDISRDEAIARYVKTEGETPEPWMIEELCFLDEFCVSSAWIPLAIEEALAHNPSLSPRQRESAI